ncbi:mechanosensitive ion channel family protein [Oceanicoccus sagamiensis]|uniref:Small-conductance mechanosensitive channel n=1 Tax=Oceanicoccus sagamiensis TaxID=716816 RepID=A0A1X9NLN6_9GAMM|nr:mechanosensitive ion channel family protein [Oceanicoccus sagamiensis]ARN75747.1 hypothetical protein BST96_17520 [Oceanicoccus sagamiensis]
MNNKLYSIFSSSFTVVACVLLLISPKPVAQETYQAVTHQNPEVAIEDLVLMLLPLNQQELEVEAAAWYSILAETLHTVTKLEIKSKRIGRQTALLDDAAGEVEDIIAAKKSGDTEDIAEAEAALMEIGQDLNVKTDKIKQFTATASEQSIAKVENKGKELEQEKSELADSIASLRLQQTRRVDRLNKVLDALEAKGGDVKELRLYTAAVSGIKINVQDSTTAWKSAYEWMKSEDGGLLLFFNLVKFLLAVIVIVLLAKAAGRITDQLTRHNSVSLLLENFLKVAARRTVFFIGLIMILPIIGINTGPVLALIGAAGLVVGLALQGTLSNFASGVLILIYRPYDINDVIEVGVGGVSGIVDSMTLISTTIKTLDNKLITVPNNSVWNDAITNITGSDVRRVDLVFGISYGDDFTVAKKIMEKILAEHPAVLDEPEPNVRVHELADSSVNFVCRPWVKTDDYWDVYWDITETVKREFDNQGVSIPFPQRDVHFYPAGELALKKD